MNGPGELENIYKGNDIPLKKNNKNNLYFSNLKFKSLKGCS